MALAAAVSDLMKKLLDILEDKEVNNSSLRKHINIAVDKLQEVQKRTVRIDALEGKLLRDVYSSDDITESFLIEKTLQRRKCLAKVRRVAQFTLPSSKSLTRGMQDLKMAIDKYLEEGSVENKDGDKQSNSNEPLAKAPQTDDRPTNGAELTSSDARPSLSNGQNEQIPEPTKAPQTDDLPTNGAELTSSEARPSLSDGQNEQIPEPTKAPQTDDHPESHTDLTSSEVRPSLSDRQNEQIPGPAKAPQKDDQPESHADLTSSEARPSLSDRQNEQIPEPTKAPQTDDQPESHADLTSSEARPSLSDRQNEQIPEPAKAPQTDDQPESHADLTSSEARSSLSDHQNEQIPEPVKAPQTDHTELTSSEARPSLSDHQNEQIPEPGAQEPSSASSLQQSSAAPSLQQPSAAPGSQQPKAEQSSEHPAAKSRNGEDKARISNEKQDLQSVKPQMPDESGERSTGLTMSGEEQASKRVPSRSDRLDDDSELVGREAKALELAQKINDRHKMNFLISVVGDAGTGKTTLVRNIYNKADTMQQFPLRAWVNVSEEFPEFFEHSDVSQMTKNLLIDILRQVTTIKEEEKLPLDKLEEKVRDYFIRKRFLVVLDDVKTSVMWESVKRSFPNSLNGSRMVLVMRNEKLNQEMNDQEFFKLENLDINESWELFLKKVKRKKEDISISKEDIFKKCKGLPLAIVVLGGLLSSKDKSSWPDEINRLSFGDDPSKAVLALAYQDLAPEWKPCLLYLGLFRKDYEIPVRRLFLLWAAEGFVKPKSGGETPESLVEIYLQELIRRNMIEVSAQRLDGSPKKCRVPGILYDNIFPNAADIGFFHTLRSTSYEQKFYIRRVAAYVDISNPDLESSIRNLRSYMSFNTRKGDTPAYEIDRFISKITMRKGYALLTVLDLENVYKPVLSETIGKLIHLIYLGLRWTFLDSVPKSVGDLPRLETLDVKHTNVTCLPISIWNSKTLRHLYMNELYLDVSLQRPLASGSLVNLLTLWGLVIGKKGFGEGWFNRTRGLRKLGLTCQFDSLSQVTTGISELKNLRSLKLRSIDVYSRPAQLKLKPLNEHQSLSELYLLGKLCQQIDGLDLPQSLRMLTLSVSQLENDPMPYLGKLPLLEILRLFARSYLGNEMTCQAKDFQKLRVLKLWMLEKLEKWTVEEGSMLSLKELEIRSCEQLNKTSGLQKLTTLKELICTNMPKEFVTDIESSIRAMPGSKVTVRSRNWDFAPLPKD